MPILSVELAIPQLHRQIPLISPELGASSSARTKMAKECRQERAVRVHFLIDRSTGGGRENLFHFLPSNPWIFKQMSHVFLVKWNVLRSG
jgi:hypothetical protein